MRVHFDQNQRFVATKSKVFIKNPARAARTATKRFLGYSDAAHNRHTQAHTHKHVARAAMHNTKAFQCSVNRKKIVCAFRNTQKHASKIPAQRTSIRQASCTEMASSFPYPQRVSENGSVYGLA